MDTPWSRSITRAKACEFGAGGGGEGGGEGAGVAAAMAGAAGAAGAAVSVVVQAARAMIATLVERSIRMVMSPTS
jgi:hypothetical protein